MGQYAEIEATLVPSGVNCLAFRVKVTSFRRFLWWRSVLSVGEVVLILDSAASVLSVYGRTGVGRVLVLRCLAENQLLPKAGELLCKAASTGRKTVGLNAREH